VYVIAVLGESVWVAFRDGAASAVAVVVAADDERRAVLLPGGDDCAQLDELRVDATSSPVRTRAETRLA
jgi:hypothetical protein